MKSASFLAFFACVLVTVAPASLHAQERVVELDPYSVVSTATRTERLAAELPIRTELLSPELFQAAGTPDLAAALEYLPGARVEANCQNCGTAEVKLLGLGAGYNQLLFDGQPLFGGLAAVYGLEHIPTAFIERVEVVKGGASTLYGPGAVAGVINIIPREPLTTRVFVEGKLELYDGEPSYTGVGVYDWVAEDGETAANVYTEYRKDTALDLNDDGFTEITEKNFFTGGTNLWFYLNEDIRVSAHYAYTDEERRGGSTLNRLPHESQLTEALDHIWHRGGLTWEQDISPDLALRLGFSASQIERDSYYGGIGAVALPGEAGHDPVEYAAAVEDARLLYGFTESTRTFSEALMRYRVGDHSLQWGVQYKDDTVFDEKRNDLDQALRTDGSLATRSGEDPIADDGFDNLGFFIQDEWDPAPEWTVITGLRADKHSELDDWILSPRAAVRYTATEAWTLRAAVSTGFRAPEIFDEDFHIEILDDPTRTRNSPGLVEERAVSFTTGFIWTPAFAENRFQADVELYRTEISDTFNVPDIVFTDAAGDFKQRENAGGSIVQGFEANFLYRATSSLSLEAGVTYSDARFDEAQEVIPGFFSKRFIESPRWGGVAQVNYTQADDFDVFLGLVWTGPMIAVNEAVPFINAETDHFFVVDASFTKHLDWADGHVDVTVGVRNLFDERQSDLEVGAERDATYFYGPRFPRSFFLSLNLTY